MPRFDYRCTLCGRYEEVSEDRHTTPPVRACAECHGMMFRVPFPAPIHFKGTGFYINDSKTSKGGESSD